VCEKVSFLLTRCRVCSSWVSKAYLFADLLLIPLLMRPC